VEKIKKVEIEKRALSLEVVAWNVE
jgi:hypothetical protein